MQLLRKITTLGKEPQIKSRNDVAESNKLGAGESTFKKIADMFGLNFDETADQKLSRSETQTYLGTVLEEKIKPKDGGNIIINRFIQG